MAARSRRGAGSSAETQKENGKGESLNRKTIETIKDATGASEEDIMVMLLECNNDINETTSRLIDNPFSQVFNKKQKKKQREEERKKDGSKVIEVRRQPSTGQGDRRNRDRGPRGSLDRNGPDRNASRAARTGSAKPAEDGSQVEEAGSAPAEEQRPATLPEPTPAKATYSRAPGPPQPAAAPSPQSSWQPEVGRTTGRKTMADLFKQPPAPAAPLPTPAAAHSVQDDYLQKEIAPTSELADLSLGDPAVSAPQRISSSPAAGVPLQSNQVTQDMQVQGPSPRHAPISSALGIAPVVVPPPRYPSSENIGAPPNAWGKPKPQSSTPVGGLASLLGTSQGVPGSMGLSSMPAAAQAAPTPISNNDVLSVADPQISSSGLLGSSAGTQLSSSYQQQADMKAAERVILPQQVRDVTNLGLQFGNIGFDPSRSFGGSSSLNATSDDLPAPQHHAPQAVPERSNAAALSASPSPAGVDAFNAGGMASSLGSYQSSGNAGYSTFSVQAPIASQPAAPAPAPTRLQESSTATSQAASNLFSGATYQSAPTPSYNNYQAPAAQQQPAGYVSGLGGYQSTQQQVPSSQPAYSYQTSTVSTSQPAYGAAQQQQQQHTSSYQAAAPAQTAQSPYSQYGQYGQQQQQQQPQPQQHQQPAAQYGQQYDAPAATTSAPAAAAKPAVSAYDNSQYGNYNQQSTLKDFQPAPKYNAGNAHSTAAHTNYGAQSHATGQTFGANTAAASTSAPLAAAPAAQQQAAFAAPGMQQQVPQYAAMGYGQQYPYMNTMPHYGMQSGYGGYPQQHPGGYGGYPAQASGYGAAANQPNVGFQQGGGNYSHAQSSKYQGGGGGYAGQGGLYGNQRMRGKDKDSYAPHAASSLYGPDGSQLHGAGPAGQYQQHGGVGREQYSYGAQGQSGAQGYGNYSGGAGQQNYSGYSQYGYGGGQNAPNGQSSGFGKLS